MLMVSFATQTPVILRPGSTTEWGQTVVDWENVTEIEVPGCTDYALSGVETINAKDVSAGARQMFMPPGTDIRGTDRIRHLGRVWEIIGEPSEQISPTGELSHIEVLLKRWEGKK